MPATRIVIETIKLYYLKDREQVKNAIKAGIEWKLIPQFESNEKTPISKQCTTRTVYMKKKNIGTGVDICLEIICVHEKFLSDGTVTMAHRYIYTYRDDIIAYRTSHFFLT